MSPSRSFAGNQVGRGCVRWERWVIGCRRALEDGPSSFLEVAITFAPKNRRISASGFRCECETDNSLKHSSGSEREGPFPFELAAEPAIYVSRYLVWIIIKENSTKRKAAHLLDSSSSTRSKSSSPSFFAFALCFFSAFRSFFKVPPGEDEVGGMTETVPVFAVVEWDSVCLSPS